MSSFENENDFDGRNFKDIVENASDIIQFVDARGRFLYVNKAWKKAFGYSDREVENLILWDIIHPQLKDRCREVFNRIISGKTVDNIETVFLDKRGRTIEVEGHVDCRIDKAGHIVGTRGIFRDVSERKRTEEHLRQIHETYLGIFNSLTEAIYIQDEKGTFLEINKGAEEFYGLTRKDLIGRDPSVVTAPGMNDLDAVARFIEKTYRTGIPSQFEFWALRKDGTAFPKDVILNKGRYFGKDVVIATARDVTDRKRAEKELREALREKDVMLREIHHRVKNNMQIISSLLRLQARNITDPGLQEALDICRKRIRSMAFVHEKLYKSKSFSHVNFGEYLRDLLNRLRYVSTAEAANLAFDIDVEDMELDINRAIPCGLIVNEIVSNALKHAFPKGGPGKIRLTMKRDSKNRIRLVVRDNGIGLPDSVNIRKPASLGLQIVRDLVDQIDGTLEIDRKGGTTVTIRF